MSTSKKAPTTMDLADRAAAMAQQSPDQATDDRPVRPVQKDEPTGTPETATADPGRQPPAAEAPAAIPVRRGRIFKPRRTIVYGEPGCGKTTAAADIDGAVYFDLNNGSELLDVRRYAFRPDDELRGHVPNTLDEFMGGIRTIYKNPAGISTLVLDLWTDLERLAVGHVIQRDAPADGRVTKGDSLERYGYGAGKQALFDECRAVLLALDKLTTRGVGVTIIAHSMVVKKSVPGGADYDHHVIQALDTKEVSMSRYLFGWADEVAFMHFDDRSAKVGKRGPEKGITGTNRILEFDHSASWAAKARLPMPRQVKVASAHPWQFMREALHRAYRMTPAELRQEILDELTRIGDAELAVKVDVAVKSAGDNIDRLTAYMQELRRRDPADEESGSSTPKDDEI